MADTQYSCPHCYGGIMLDPSLAGRIVACPHCGGQLEMPQVVIPVAEPTTDSGLPLIDVPESAGPGRFTLKNRQSRRKHTPFSWYIGGGFLGLILLCAGVGSLIPESPEGKAARERLERLEAE